MMSSHLQLARRLGNLAFGLLEGAWEINPWSPADMHSNSRTKMARAARAALRTTESTAPGLPLPRAQLLHMRSAFRELLGQRSGKRGDQWRQSVLQSLRVLTASDKAILVVRTGTEPVGYADGVSRDVLAAYITRFAHLDRSRSAGRDHEAWSLHQLWGPGELEQSEYYRGFAAPNRLHDTVGLTLHFPSLRSEICLLLHKTVRESSASLEHRRDLIEVLLEPVRAGFAIDLSTADPVPQLSSLIDVTGQALMLFGMDGRELSQNPVMRRIFAQEREREVLLEHIRGVARAVLAKATANGRSVTNDTPQSDDGTRREVATSQAAYRLRGNLVGRNPLGHGTAILVSVDRVAYQVPAPDSIRARYGLTVRELQVASLIMHRLTNAEIARMLGVSPHTARHHTENVLAKFGVRSREALRRAITEGPAA
jgi:DNA-binding CsgD family transcriptional regulator